MPQIEDLARLRLAQFKSLDNDIEYVDKKTIEFLLQGWDLNITVPDAGFLKDQDDEEIVGDSLLHLTFKNGDICTYNILICKGADFNIKDKKGNTVLHKAFHKFCSNYKASLCDFQKGEFNAKFITLTLSKHVEHGNTSNTSDSNGLTHFHVACGTNNTAAIKFFLNNGVSINQAVVCVSSNEFFKGYTPLHFAAEFECVEAIEILLKHGANTNLEDNKGQTPLHVALKKNIEMMDSAGRVPSPRSIEINQQVISLLLNHSINPKLSHLFVASAMKDSCHAKSLLDQGIDANLSINMDCQTWPGYTAVHFAAHVNVDTVKLLIKHGANVLAKAANEVTSLDMCVDRYKAEEISNILCIVPSWKNIVLSDSKTKLVDLLLAFNSLDSVTNFLQESKGNVKLFVPFDSPLWPGITVLQIAVLLAEREKCKTNYNRERDGTIFDPGLNIVEECLKQGADVTVKDHRNQTAIHLAFRLNKQKTLDLLLRHHHKIESSVDDENLSHLHIACAKENEDLVKKFAWNNADVNVVYKGERPINSVYPGWTPLHVAVYKHNSEIVELLLQFGADTNVPDTHGFTPIHQLMHCIVYRKKLSEILFNSSIPRDSTVEDVGLSYLHVACAVDNVDAAKRLLDLGADVNKAVARTEDNADNHHPLVLICKKYEGNTPLHFALAIYDSGRSELLSLLLERGADILVKNRSSVPQSPLHEILECRIRCYLNIVIDLLKRDVDLRKRVEAETGLTLLHVACRKVDVDLARELLDNGADVNARIHENSTLWPNCTCLHVLVYDQNLTGTDENVNDTIKLLLERNADVTLSDGYGDSPVHIAYRKLCIELVCSKFDNIVLLLKAQKNFNVNPTSVEGLSHFHIACQMLELEVVENFLEHDVDVNLKIDAFYDSTIAASTALHLAIKSTTNFRSTNPLAKLIATLEMVDLLIKHGADADVEDILGNRPAHYTASSKGNLLQRLAKCGADLDARNVRGETPLELLLKKKDFTLEEVGEFITFGCSFNAFDRVTKQGYIALANARLPHYQMQRLLVEAFVNSPDSMKKDDVNRTAIQNLVSISASRTSETQYAELIDILVKYGCDLDDQDNLGRTALHLAAQFRNESSVAGLLLAGADINITDRSGKTPFACVFEPCSRCPERYDKEHDQYSHAELFHTFMSQIKKMELCNVFVNQLNGVLLNRALQRFGSASIATVLNDILPEARQTVNIKIEPYSLTLADFVSTAAAVIDYPTMSLAKRTAINAFFRANKRRFRERFKQTASVFQLQYRQAVLREKIINEAVESLRVLARCRLPDICSHIILRSLKNFELQNLISSTAEIKVTTDVDIVERGMLSNG